MPFWIGQHKHVGMESQRLASTYMSMSCFSGLLWTYFFLSLTSNPASPFHKTWQNCVLCLILLNFLIMLGHTAIVHLSLLLLFYWILLVTWILMSSNIVIIGFNLDSIIQLLNDSLMLLSTDSQFDPSLNQALHQCIVSVLSKSIHPVGFFTASLFL